MLVVLLFMQAGKQRLLVLGCVCEGDILEAPGRQVHQPVQASHRWRFGTLGTGLDIIRQVWLSAEHVFSSQTVELALKLEGRPGALEVGPPSRVKANILSKHPVDILSVDMVETDLWEGWVESAPATLRPKIIMDVTVPEQLVDEQLEAARRQQRKRLQTLGYDSVSWFLRAHEHGAALHQDRLIVVYFRAAWGHTAPTPPLVDGLPPRAMSNLLAPVGIPHSAWARKPMCRASTTPPSANPCRISGHLGGSPVFDITGAMPDQIGAWVKTERGCRRLQHLELAKAKGLPPDWPSATAADLPAKAIHAATCVHLMTAVGDSIMEWLNGGRSSTDPPPVPTTSPEGLPLAEPPATPSAPLSAEGDEGGEWSWEVPDLTPGAHGTPHD
jgi:hypothetical protein